MKAPIVIGILPGMLVAVIISRLAVNELEKRGKISARTRNHVGYAMIIAGTTVQLAYIISHILTEIDL